MPWCTSGLLSRCSSFRLLQGAFLEVSPELTARVGDTTQQPRALPARDVPVQKVVFER